MPLVWVSDKHTVHWLVGRSSVLGLAQLPVCWTLRFFDHGGGLSQFVSVIASGITGSKSLLGILSIE